MGLAASEIAVNLIPCCCNTIGIRNPIDLIDFSTEEEEYPLYSNTEQKTEQKVDRNYNAPITEEKSDFSTDEEMEDVSDDDFYEDPDSKQTENVLARMSWDVMDATEDLWNVLDEIFFSYQPSELTDIIKSKDTGLKKGLQIILDDYTQNAVFKSVQNYATHQRKHKFDITKTMSIAEYVPTSYQTEPLPFYEDRNYGFVSGKMECDEVCRYECAEGEKYLSQNGLMDCDNRHRHIKYPQNTDRCILHLQYISFGSIRSPYFKTRQNYAKEENKWCFKNEKKEERMDVIADGDSECTVIAFSSFGQHHTSVYSYDKPERGDYGNSDFMRKKIEFLNAVAYVNDVSYLKKYAVRKGYNKYGALAYFNKEQKVIAIQTYWDNRIWMKPQNLYDKKYLAQWKYAKWIWKISVIISSYVTEWLAKCRFREINSYLQCIHKHLNINHCIRRLFKPFVYGSVSANEHFKDCCKEFGIFHRIFGFEYKSFRALLNDGMKTYRFKILRKKFTKLKQLDSVLCPGFGDFDQFWKCIHNFVSKYITIYYGENKSGNDQSDFLLNSDPKLRGFYDEVTDLLGIHDKYRFKRFNVVMLITHFICTVTVYNKHLTEALSWDGIFLAKLFYSKSEYSLQSYSGCAIRANGNNNNALNFCENDILSYTEFVLLIANNGIKEKNFDLQNIWSLIILKDDSRQDCIRLFRETHKNLQELEKQIRIKNKTRRIPYTACCISHLQSSACL